jgi:hypothetical protein
MKREVLDGEANSQADLYFVHGLSGRGICDSMVQRMPYWEQNTREAFNKEWIAYPFQSPQESSVRTELLPHRSFSSWLMAFFRSGSGTPQI